MDLEPCHTLPTIFYCTELNFHVWTEEKFVYLYVTGTAEEMCLPVCHSYRGRDVFTCMS